MKKSTFKSVVFIFTFCCITTTIAQGVLREIPLSKKVKISNLLIEGKVLVKRSFWDAEMQHIYTSNTVEIYKIFKGNVSNSTIEIITLGGTVGFQAEKVVPSLQLQKNGTGIFFLKNSDLSQKESFKGGIRYMPSAGMQSFYIYDLNEASATGVFQKYDNISNDLYRKIKGITNSPYKEVKKFSIVKRKRASQQIKADLSVTSFSPSSIPAGTQSVLTINGTDFGATKGKVKFRNADTGGFFTAEALSTQILTWTNTQITVEVPDIAGTGKIQVITSEGASSNSANNLNITFAETNVQYDFNGETAAFQAQHANIDGNGGYNWKMYIDFDANSDAKASFIRAMNSWRCNSKVYWELDGTSTIDKAERDGVNIIRFDIGNELPDGTAGRCTSYYSGCTFNGGTEIAWYIEELDIVFDNFDANGINGTNWEYGPALPGNNEYDFESVAVHELGHGHQLGHVIDTNDFMHRSLTNGASLREPGINNLLAANDVQSRSLVFDSCGQSPMDNFDCSSLGVENYLLSGKIILYPSFTDKEIFISNSELIPLKEARFYDVRGLLVKKELLNNLLSQKINIESLKAGLYFVQIKSDKGSISRKIIIE